MKRRISSLIILICFLMFTLIFNVVVAGNQEEPYKDDEISASVIVTSGDEFILKLSSTSNDVDVLTQVATRTLAHKNETNITPDSTFCCEPNQPKRTVRYYFHIRLGNGTCESYYRDAKQCLTCGAVYPLGPIQDYSTHKTTSACP